MLVIRLSVKPKLTPLEKWILWHLYIDGPENYLKPIFRGYQHYTVKPEFLIEIIPIPLLSEINKIRDVTRVLDALGKKGYLNHHYPNHYSLNAQGILIFRKYVISEIMNLVMDIDRTKVVISKLEKNAVKESSKVAKILKEIAEKVKDKAEEDVADAIWDAIKTLGSIAFGYLIRAITSS